MLSRANYHHTFKMARGICRYSQPPVENASTITTGYVTSRYINMSDFFFL